MRQAGSAGVGSNSEYGSKSYCTQKQVLRHALPSGACFESEEPFRKVGQGIDEGSVGNMLFGGKGFVLVSPTEPVWVKGQFTSFRPRGCEPPFLLWLAGKVTGLALEEIPGGAKTAQRK